MRTGRDPISPTLRTQNVGVERKVVKEGESTHQKNNESRDGKLDRRSRRKENPFARCEVLN